jgi:hypothetical protein
VGSAECRALGDSVVVVAAGTQTMSSSLNFVPADGRVGVTSSHSDLPTYIEGVELRSS